MVTLRVTDSADSGAEQQVASLAVNVQIQVIVCQLINAAASEDQGQFRQLFPIC